MIIKPILIFAIITTLLFFARHANNLKVKACKRIFLFLFMGFSSVFIIYPDLLTNVARAIGVGRGTDLMLYALVVVFIFTILNIYLKFKEIERKNSVLAREIAIQNTKISLIEKEKSKK